MKAIIVDDEAVAAAAMKRRIAWENYGIDEVLQAASMRQAIQVMEEAPVDLMLCDVEMPGGSGLELYEWVRTYRPDTECIFVSCHPEYEYVRKALTMGSMDYVLKPVDYEEMDRILQEAARRIHSRKERLANGQGDSASENIAHEGTLQNDSKKFVDNAGRSDGYPPAAAGDTSNTSGFESKTSGNSNNLSDTSPVDASNSVGGKRPLSEPLAAAIAYIRDNLSSNMSIKDIAQVACLNPQYFMRLFKKETGSSVLEYITECRLNRAKELLAQTNLPITEVALSVGYDNFSYFSKLFKRNEGMSPSDYRHR